jgi:hypothetical protein
MSINRISGNILQDNLQRGANLSIQGNLIYFDVTSNRVGIKTSTLSDDFTVANVANVGNLRLASASANAVVFTNSTSLATATSNLTFDGSTLTAAGNIAAGNIVATSRVSGANAYFTGNVDLLGNLNATSGVVYSSRGVFYGNSTTGNIATVVGVPGYTALGTNVVSQFAGNVNAYSQINSQNINNGTQASTDLVLTSNNGTDTTYYVNLGIAGSTWNGTQSNSLGNAVAPDDSYLYSHDGNLVIGTAVAGTTLKILAGGNNSNFVVATYSNVGVAMSANINMNSSSINNVAAPVANGDATNKLYVDSITSNIVANLGNITFSNTTISTSQATGNITLLPTSNSTVIISTTSGLVLPVGNITQRPSPAATGTVRFNTETVRVEVYDGAEWDSIASGVTNQILYGDNSNTIFTLDRVTTAAAALVALNGVLQVPSLSYTVAGNLITFVQAPAISDIIDVRFL